MYLDQLEVGNFAVFCYIIGCEETKEGAVIDPSGEIDKIIALAEKNNISIKSIINTHAHIDHIMGNAEMAEKTGAKIIIHHREKEILEDKSSPFLRMFNARPSPPADILVHDNDLIKVGKITLKVIHTPGHSPGAISLYTDSCLFTGDTLFVRGVGRTDLPDGSSEILRNSIITKLFVLPDETKVLPGHNYGSKPTSTILEEKLYNPFLRD